MPEEPRPSVFGYVDQAEVIKKIDAVSDDDLSSCFFGDSIADVENAATEIFDIGVRDEAESDGQSSSHPFAVPAGQMPAAQTPAAPPQAAPVPPSTAPAPTPLTEDAKARSAFILGGPGAVKKE